MTLSVILFYPYYFVRIPFCPYHFCPLPFGPRTLQRSAASYTRRYNNNKKIWLQIDRRMIFFLPAATCAIPAAKPAKRESWNPAKKNRKRPRAIKQKQAAMVVIAMQAVL